MAFITFNDVALMTLNWDIFGQRCQNTMYFFHSPGWSTLSLETAATLLGETFGNELEGEFSNSLTLSSVSYRDMTAEDSFVGEVPINIVGTRTSPGLPTNVTLSIKFLTGLAGRAKRGRNYFAGLTEDQVTGLAVIGSNVTNILAGYQAVFDVMAGESYTWVVASRALVDPEVGGEGDIYQITSFATDGFVDSQRRRLAGRGI